MPVPGAVAIFPRIRATGRLADAAVGLSNVARQARFRRRAEAAGRQRVQLWLSQKLIEKLKRRGQPLSVTVETLLTRALPPASRNDPRVEVKARGIRHTVFVDGDEIGMVAPGGGCWRATARDGARLGGWPTCDEALEALLEHSGRG
jgi:hypothetical protein